MLNIKDDASIINNRVNYFIEDFSLEIETPAFLNCRRQAMGNKYFCILSS